MSETTIVLGAAIIRDFRLFVARRSQPPSMSGFWELPGDEVPPGGNERSTIEDEFTTEFGVPVRCVDQIGGDRMLTSWRTAENESVPASLRIWRCQFPAEMTFDIDLGDPRPSMHRYDETQWIPIDDLDSVGPWRDEARIAASEVADYYLGDVVWQSAD
jgi:8-oxo-dGTP diphosphatase